MDGDLQRLDDKMKLANLQIDRRLAIVEEGLAEVQKNVRNVTEEVVGLKNRPADLSGLSEQFSQLRASFTDLRNKLEHVPVDDLRPEIEKLSKRLEALEKQMVLSVPIILD
jgi:archaellum component FlaC